MVLSRKDVIVDSLRYSWHAPILRALVAGPARYSEIRAGLFERQGEPPADGVISKGLKALQALGLVAREPPDSPRAVWELTDQGRWAVTVIDDWERGDAADLASDQNLTDDGSSLSVRPISLDTGGRREKRMANGQSGEAIDSTKVHPARRYNYWLGGKDNFAADRASADEIEKAFPTIRLTAQENRAFLRRAVGYLTADAGIRQFLDIGTGLPTADNTHEVAQRIAADSRIVYVDNDPLVLVHARALLNSSSHGKTAYLEADLRRPDDILGDPQLTATLDLTRPVALVLVAVLHFIHGRAAAQPIVDRLMSALPTGSYLVATHATEDFASPELRARYQELFAAGRADVWPRDRAEFGALFDGLDLVKPGLVPVSQWRPEPKATIPPRGDTSLWAAVGRKP